MLELAHPLWLALLPLIAVWLFLAWRQPRDDIATAWTLNHPGLSADQAAATPADSKTPLLLTGLALILLTLALAQPRQVGAWIAPPPEGRDIALIIDTSQTMSIDDFQLDGKKAERLAVLKSVLRRFIEARSGDRFGVIAFGSHAATLTPPTFDRRHAVDQLLRLQIGMAGDNTALGDALGLALQQVRQTRLRPALILVSDGQPSNSGDLTPTEAVAVARQLGVAIHTLQIGGDLFAAGRSTTAAATDEQPDLVEIARLTHGRHWMVNSTDDAEQVIRAIGELETTLARPSRNRQIREWYGLPLALAALLLTLANIRRAR